MDFTRTVEFTPPSADISNAASAILTISRLRAPRFGAASPPFSACLPFLPYFLPLALGAPARHPSAAAALGAPVWPQALPTAPPARYQLITAPSRSSRPWMMLPGSRYVPADTPAVAVGVNADGVPAPLRTVK